MDIGQPGDIPLRERGARVSGASQNSIQSLDEAIAESLDAPLERRLGLWSGMAIVMGSIIGSGIFSTPGLILGSVGSVGMSILVWVIGAVVSLCG
ncbi:low-affinity methionine permease, partial [Coemansia sp. RSA 2603]